MPTVPAAVSKAFTREDDIPVPVVPERRVPTGPRPLTPEGHARFVEERASLEGDERPDAVERRRSLDVLLERAVLAPAGAGADGRAVLGAWVEVEDADGKRRTLRLVGGDEADSEGGLVRVDSPLGAAILGRSVGDSVLVERPRDTLELRVLKVSDRR